MAPRTNSTSRSSKSKSKRGPYTEKAYRYANEVGNAKHAPRWVRHQCQDFVNQFDRKSMCYSESAVENTCMFFESLPPPMGNYGENDLIKLAPAQVYWTAELYGRRNQDDPSRRQYREFYLVVPRKAGKSTYGAAMCIRELCAPGRRGALAQCGGMTEDHAKHVYDRARKMVDASEDLREKYSLVASGRQIRRTDGSGAEMRATSGNIKDGYHPVIATFDELHATRNPEPIEVFRSSFGTTKNSMLAKFTTAGHVANSLGLAEREEAIQNFRGTIVIPNQLSLLYEWDEDIGLDDGDPMLWAAVHPLYHHTVEPDFYPTAYQKSLVSSHAKSEFDHKLLCKWLRGDQANCITERQWDALPEAPDINKANIQRAWVGVDSAKVHDLTSITLLGELPDGSLAAWWWVFMPPGRIGETSSSRGTKDVMTNRTLQAWVDGGYIKTCGDTRIDFAVVADAIANLIRNYPVDLVFVDQYSGNAEIFKNLPDPCKPKTAKIKKWASTFTPPMQEIIGRVEDGKLMVDRSPVVKWGVCNAVMDDKTSGTMLPKKVSAKSNAHIDPLDSLVLAFLAMQNVIGGEWNRKKGDPIPLSMADNAGMIEFI